MASFSRSHSPTAFSSLCNCEMKPLKSIRAQVSWYPLSSRSPVLFQSRKMPSSTNTGVTLCNFVHLNITRGMSRNIISCGSMRNLCHFIILSQSNVHFSIYFKFTDMTLLSILFYISLLKNKNTCIAQTQQSSFRKQSNKLRKQIDHFDIWSRKEKKCCKTNKNNPSTNKVKS